jgi:hypothetical protein
MLDHVTLRAGCCTNQLSFNFTAGGAISEGDMADTTSGFTARLGRRYPLSELGEMKFVVDYANSWDVVKPGSE